MVRKPSRAREQAVPQFATILAVGELARQTQPFPATRTSRMFQRAGSPNAQAAYGQPQNRRQEKEKPEHLKRKMTTADTTVVSRLQTVRARTLYAA